MSVWKGERETAALARFKNNEIRRAGTLDSLLTQTHSNCHTKDYKIILGVVFPDSRSGGLQLVSQAQ